MGETARAANVPASVATWKLPVVHPRSKRQPRRAARAVDAQRRGLAVGVPVAHADVARVAALDNEHAVGAEREAARAPRADLVGGRIALRGGERQEVVAAARDFVERAHGTRVATGSQGEPRLPDLSIAATR